MLIHEFTKIDLGKTYIKKTCSTCRHCETIHLGSTIGYVRKQDLGKRLFKTNGVIHVENDQQLKERTKT